MLLIRPLQTGDLDDLYAMAENAGKGLTTLPADRELLQRKIDRTRDSFNQRSAPEAGLYLFALEDTETGKTVGISGIEARVGLEEVFYNYRLSLTVNASRELGVHVRTPTLHLSNDMTDTTEICSLLLANDYQGGGTGFCCPAAGSCSWTTSASPSPTRCSQKCGGWRMPAARAPCGMPSAASSLIWSSARPTGCLVLVTRPLLPSSCRNTPSTCPCCRKAHGR